MNGNKASGNTSQSRKQKNQKRVGYTVPVNALNASYIIDDILGINNTRFSEYSLGNSG